jgi:hypothetical protein
LTKKLKWIAVGVIVVAIVGIRVGVGLAKTSALTANQKAAEASLETLTAAHDFSSLKQYVPTSESGLALSVFSITSWPNMPQAYKAVVYGSDGKFYSIMVDGSKVSFDLDEKTMAAFGKRSYSPPTTTDFQVLDSAGKAVKGELPGLIPYLIPAEGRGALSIISLTDYPVKGSWSVKAKGAEAFYSIVYDASNKNFTVTRDVSAPLASDYGEGE